MQLTDYAGKILSLSEAIYRWLGALSGLDDARRAKLARYAEAIAATLQRATEAMARLEADPADPAARRQMLRELGRITGYVETMMGPLRHDLDGRKLAGVKRRLEQLEGGVCRCGKAIGPAPEGIERIVAAEGYFRALADGLRA